MTPKSPDSGQDLGKVRHDPQEYAAGGWKNPYLVYILLVTALFLFLILMGYLAWTNGWIPSRGSPSGA